jgi:hypothetical protein
MLSGNLIVSYEFWIFMGLASSPYKLRKNLFDSIDAKRKKLKNSSPIIM